MTRKPVTLTLIQIFALVAAGCSVQGPSERVMPDADNASRDDAPAKVERTSQQTGADALYDLYADGSSDSFGVVETVTAQDPEPGTLTEPAEPALTPEEFLAAGREAWTSGDFAEAARNLQGAVDGEAGGPYEVYLLGLAHWKSGDAAAAEPCLEEACWNMQQFVRAPVNLARVRIELGQLAEAEEAIDTALAIDPDFGPAHNVRGRILLERGAVDEALEAFSRAAELGADDAWPLNNAGYALLVSGEHARAVSFLEQAVERNDTHAVMWNNLALAREGLGDLAAAAKAAERAAAITDGTGQYQETFERLAALVPAQAETEAVAEAGSDVEIASAKP